MKDIINYCLFTLLAAVLLGVAIYGIYHTHCGTSFSRSYCPNCYKPSAIRVDLQKYCEECGYNFYLNYDELPDSIK